VIASLTHPGPAPACRWATRPCHATPVDLILPVAETLAQSVALALAGFDGGWLEIENAALGTLDFVVPGPDPTGAHAAWYAGPYRMGAGHIRHLGLHAGRKQGAPWLHGHGTFDAPGWDGPRMGHILPLESRLSRPTPARGWAIRGARLDVVEDPETRFPLFQPVATGPAGPGALVTLRPNQDITGSLEALAASIGLGDARVLGLGSLVHPRLIGQPPIDSFATEILLTEGTITNGKASLSARIVTLDGTLHEGPLQPGANGICITAELLLLPA